MNNNYYPTTTFDPASQVIWQDDMYRQNSTIPYSQTGNSQDDRFFFAPFVVGGLAGTALGYGIANNNQLNKGGQGCCMQPVYYYPQPQPYPYQPYPYLYSSNNTNYYY